LDDTVRFIADEGVAGMEFSGLDDGGVPNPVTRAGELRALCDKLGLEIAGYNVGAELLVPPDRQSIAITQLKQAVDVCEALGAKTMRHDVTRGPADKVDMGWQAVLDGIVPAIQAVADYAASKHIRTTVENHGFYMQTADRIEKLIKAVDRPNYGVMLDMGNFLCLNQDPVAAVRQLARYAFSVHVKDFHVRPVDRLPPSGWFSTPTEIGLRGAILGHGQIDIPAQLRELKSANYNGWISLEFEGMEEPTMAVHQGLQYLRTQIAAAGL
jgi:sugar phosphate isomerase/epimerase